MLKPQLSIRDVRVLSAASDLERLQCSVCHDVLLDPRACRAGHTFCLLCIERWLGSSQTCPVDRAKLTPEDLVIPALAKELTGRLKVACPNETRDQREAGDQGPPCRWSGPFEELEGHLKVCESGIVACEWCKKEGVLAVTTAHALICDHRPVACEHCHLLVKARDVAAHVDGPCVFSPTGDVQCFCGQTVKRKDEDAHLNASVVRHLRVQQEQMVAQEKRLSTQIEAQQKELAELRRLSNTTLVYPWNVKLEPDSSKIVRSASVMFAGISLVFVCKWENDAQFSVLVGPVASDGPPITVDVVFSGHGKTRELSLRSNGESLLDGVWYKDQIGGFTNVPLPPPAADGTFTLRLELKRK
jgi:hypothetical protein